MIAYATAALDDAERIRLESHLADCAECRSVIAALAPDASEAQRERRDELGDELREDDALDRPRLELGQLVSDRYLIERELGVGGMGIVYAAFDVELERRVALKVLRDDVATGGHERLLREARAMARLSHSNVVAVYEVGRSDGRDYIAMELVAGESLAVWLGDEPRTVPQILEAFVAAGHGLAAAHDAAVVHRDFKPHNVVRSRDGRIVVTDFGLARETPAASPHADASPLSGLTMTGAIIGTPAYMAPEQWIAGAVTPATDQFAFCVALWEALAGHRPYRGRTGDELRAQVLDGPARLDPAGIPSALRATLRRGLAVDPARRWPTMHALLRSLQRGQRRAPRVAFAAAIVAALAAGAMWAGAASPATGDDAATCDPPLLQPEAAWSAPSELAIRNGAPITADRLAHAVAQWRVLRELTCRVPGPARAARLACLDKILVRVDALRRARLLDPHASTWGVVAQLYEPEVCLRDEPPRLPDHYSDAAVVGLALRSGAQLTKDQVARARAATDGDPCARAYLGFVDVGGGVPGAAEAARAAAEACGDDQALGAALLNVLGQRTVLFRDPRLARVTGEADAVIRRAAHPFLTRQQTLFRADQALFEDDFDRALGLVDDDRADDPAEFRVRIGWIRLEARLQRGMPADFAAVRREVEAVRTAWLVAKQPAELLAAFDATARWYTGEVAGTHAILDASNAALLPPATGRSMIHGKVIDAAGRPIRGVVITAGPGLVGDAASAAVQLYDPMDYPHAVHTATTGADGSFTVASTSTADLVIAQRDDWRSDPAPLRDGVVLVIAATRAIRGHVAIAGIPGLSWIEARTGDTGYTIVAPILADGTYALAGLPRRATRVRVARSHGAARSYGPTRVFAAGDSTNVALASPPARMLAVNVRSSTAAAIDGAFVTVLPGDVEVRTVAELDRLIQQGASASEVARASLEPAATARRGDLIAAVRGVPDGPLTVCARGVNVDANDPAFWTKYKQAEPSQPVHCTRVERDAASITIEVPAMPRLP